MKYASWLLLVFALLSLQCGYRLTGLGRNLPAGAQTIAIPEFTNETPRHQVQQFATIAVQDELIRRSGLHLSDSMNRADLILEGRISTFETMPIDYSGHGTTTTYEIRITTHFRLLDMKKNEVFLERSGLVFRETYQTSAADFFSQDAGALMKIAAKYAASVVTAILDNY